jgi:hypothetical protein
MRNPTLVPLPSTRRQLRKMETSGEHKSFCVLAFHVNKSAVSVQRHFRTKFGTDPPSDKSIRKWYLQFQDTGCICIRRQRKKQWSVSALVPQISPRVISSCGVSSWILCLYHQFQRRWVTYARASQQPSQWLTTTCYKEFGRNLITGFMCVVLRVKGFSIITQF